jgi:spore coat protein A
VRAFDFVLDFFTRGDLLPRTRRSFLQQASALGLTYIAHRSLAQQQMPGMTMPMAPASDASAVKPLPPMLHARDLEPFVDPLPLPAAAQPNGHGHLRIAMRETHIKVHRDVPATRMWLYQDLNSHAVSQLGPLLEARTHQPVQVEWLNQLPTKHFLPIDYSLHGCGHDVPDVRACVHLHGGRNPTADDGHPEAWYVPGKSFTAHYPLQQDAATLWYHDHAMGINRLNMYAGLIGVALVRDPAEDALHLPSGKYDVPLLIYDRLFTAEGQVYYPVSSDPNHPWVPEFNGDAILINNKINPYFDVEPRLYRFRLINGSNSRFFALSLTGEQTFHQIGSDQGLLATPVPMKHLQLAPGERVDLLVDFSAASGKNVHLINGVVDTLQFRVAQTTTQPPAQTALSIPSQLRSITRTPVSSATVTRTVTLDEAVDHIGNSMLMYLNKKRWHEPVTEMPKLDSTEIWEFVNLTEDTHPMHLHLVRFQVLDRRLFDVFAYRNGKGLHYIADALAPEPNEMGWKDVAQCPPGLITRIIVTFDGYPGDYLYHCHILEHEANDMMRPFRVIA